LLAFGGDYRAFVLARTATTLPLVASCVSGRTVTETAAGDGRPRTVATPGVYVLLDQPEGARQAFVWVKDKFERVWVAD
jgi:hypothetical protein